MDASKEIKRQRFLANAKRERIVQAKMREVAAAVGLSPDLYPPAEWRDKMPSRIPADRGTGRTTRMLLKAAANALLDESPVASLILIQAHDSRYADILVYQLREWFKELNTNKSISVKAVVGSVSRYAGYDPRRTRFYYDHHVFPLPAIHLIGREWSN